ncbi:MAG: hypothetical protein H6868_09155 [Rhodospirillales bacterium]|nr:hypothetical protein [Rhodospirillales bacterium]
MAAIFFFSVPEAYAARFSGAYLLHICEKDDKGKETVKGGHTACQAYIAGVIDYHNVLRSMKMAPQVDICVPKDVSSNVLHDIVLTYLRNHPENDSFVAAPAVTMALYGKYPCR